jgi:hypothetical protein
MKLLSLLPVCALALAACDLTAPVTQGELLVICAIWTSVSVVIGLVKFMRWDR